MFLYEIPEFAPYPRVILFVREKLEMQFADVREMMLLPGFNFASVATLCNLVSGVSASLFKPQRSKKVRKKKKESLGSGDRFHRLLWTFYPWERGERKFQKTKKVYFLVRNPLAHSLGEHDNSDEEITIRKTGLKKEDKPLSREELDELERSPARPSWVPLGLVLKGKKWVMSAEGFYRGVFQMVWNLAKDSGQMGRAERRFKNGKILYAR